MQFNATYIDQAGAASIAQTALLVNGFLYGGAACFVSCFPASNSFGLLNDAGTTFMYVPAGSSTSIQNSQWALGPDASAVAPGTTINTSFTISFFTGKFSGTKNIYATEWGLSRSSSGWVLEGAWTVQ